MRTPRPGDAIADAVLRPLVGAMRTRQKEMIMHYTDDPVATPRRGDEDTVSDRTTHWSRSCCDPS